jgi:hypothetical protein
MSQIEAAVAVLAKAKQPMNCKAMVEAMQVEGLWTNRRACALPLKSFEFPNKKCFTALAFGLEAQKTRNFTTRKPATYMHDASKVQAS